MPSPPSCPVTGRHLRYMLLTAISCYLIYYLYTGISADPTTSNVVHLCDTPAQMVQCSGPDDTSTCSAFTDANGLPSACIESSCGYKLFDHMDVSIAGSSDPLDPQAATSPDSLWAILAVMYSLFPYAMAFLYLVLFLASGSLVPFNRFVLFGFIAALNELIFKRIVREYRPGGSCLYFQSYGMPSGHSESSIGLMTYVLLEMFVYHPNILCGLTCQKSNSSGDNYNFELGYGWIKSNNTESNNAMSEPLQSSRDEETGEVAGVVSNNYGPPNDNNDATNTSSKNNASPTTSLSSLSKSKWFCHICALLYTIIFLPVPFSRVYLHDHYTDQVLVGAAIGIVVSTICYFGVMRGCGLYDRMRRFAGSEWGEWWGVRSSWEYGFL